MRRLAFLFAIALTACFLPVTAFAASIWDDPDEPPEPKPWEKEYRALYPAREMLRLYNPNTGEHFYT